MDIGEQEERFSNLENHARSQEKQLGDLQHQVRNLAQVQNAQTVKLDKIAEAVTKQEFSPRFDFQKSVQIVRDLFVVAATIGGLSIWLVITLTAANDQVAAVKLEYITKTQELHKQALERLESRFGWVPRVEGKL